MDCDEDHSEEFERTWCRSFLQRLLWKHTEGQLLLCGSFSELPFCYVLTNFTDIDRMEINRNIVAIPRGVAFARNFRQEILTIDASDTHLGFVHLLKEHSSDARYFNINRWGLHGPARAFEMKEDEIMEQFKDTVKIEPTRIGLGQPKLDKVIAIFCPYWPSEAQDWITRTPLSGWPDKFTKDRMVRGGCHFVAKSHYTEPTDDTQCRYSFSQAEVVLIHSWNSVQKYIYHILRVIKGRVVRSCRTEEKSVFNNYFIKTLMLWACEKNPAEYWAEENVEASVKELLRQTIECLIDRKCPHYFILGLNILDCAVGSEITSEVFELEQFISVGVPRILADFPKLDEKMIMRSEVSKAMIMYWGLSTISFGYVNPLDPEFGIYNLSGAFFSDDLMNCSELENLSKGILAHISLRLQSLKYPMRIRGSGANMTPIEHFRLCLDSDKHSIWKINLHDSVHVNIGRIVNQYIAEGAGEPGINTCCSFRLHDRVGCYERIPRNLPLRSAWYEFAVIEINSVDKLILGIFKKFYVNILTAISRLFCANFYHTYLHNYREALDICRQTLQMFESKRLIGNNFPVPFLSCDLMPVFDENIQIVFGFVGLFICVGYEKKMNRGNLIKICPPIMSPSTGEERICRKRISRHSRIISSLVVQLCPATFFRYIGRRCEKQLGLANESLFDMSVLLLPGFDKRLTPQSFMLLQCANSIAMDCKKCCNTIDPPNKKKL